MDLILASLATVTAALIGAVLFLASRQRAMDARQRELIRHLHELQFTVAAQRQQLESLKTGLHAVQSNGISQQALDPLALIEQLSDVAALQDDQSIMNAAQEIALPAGVASNLFEANRKLVSISRLLSQGNSLPEIAARLNLPLGEVELLANARS